jgi:uncharacterized protein YdeI (YjbR/CyaY-like superfamily)
MSIQVFDSAAEFRKWLEKNHTTTSELWLGFYNQRSGKKGITYREALEEALCFGWIDGVRKSVTETTYKQRFTPRNPKSYWSAINIKRAENLMKSGRMTPAGMKAFERRRAIRGSIHLSHDRQNCLFPTRDNSRPKLRPGNSSGHRRPGISAPRVFG